MIVPLLVTILVESLVISGYSRWRRKPAGPTLLTSLAANLLTQSILWIVLNLYFASYLITLLTAEGLIWIMEGVLLSVVPANRLLLREAFFLSLGMNLASFGIGWFLPL